MNKYICKAKTVSDGKWVYGYYVRVPWDNGNKTVHLIIETNATYLGAGEFAWNSVRRVDPETVCRCVDDDVESNDSFNDLVDMMFGGE